MGGRGAGSGGGATGGLDLSNITGTTSLISAREGNASEVDGVLSVLRDVGDQYGVEMSDVQLATIQGRGSNTLGYYDSNGNLAINRAFFDNDRMNAALDNSGNFHPDRGNRSGLEAVTAHEAGHRLADALGERAGLGQWQIDRVSGDVVRDAMRDLGYRGGIDSFRRQISGYAGTNNSEALAEAFSDVYCNGNNASSASRAIVGAFDRRWNSYN